MTDNFRIFAEFFFAYSMQTPIRIFENFIIIRNENNMG
uniref:Uncharacterized protein n=1 Tax=Ascaris lumbricoides TaxID=6252 RepID=A0A0M3INC1_ASCLU